MVLPGPNACLPLPTPNANLSLPTREIYSSMVQFMDRQRWKKKLPPTKSVNTLKEWIGCSKQELVNLSRELHIARFKYKYGNLEKLRSMVTSTGQWVYLVCAGCYCVESTGQRNVFTLMVEFFNRHSVSTYFRYPRSRRMAIVLALCGGKSPAKPLGYGTVHVF